MALFVYLIFFLSMQPKTKCEREHDNWQNGLILALKKSCFLEKSDHLAPNSGRNPRENYRENEILQCQASLLCPNRAILYVLSVVQQWTLPKTGFEKIFTTKQPSDLGAVFSL
jgi:hypothetical protein